MLLLEVWQMLGMKIFAFVVHSLTSSLHTCLHPLFRSDKGAEEKQLSVNAIHDEGHDLILYEWHKVLARVILWFTKFCQAPWLSLPFASRNVTDSGHIFCMMICPDLGLIIIYLSTPTVTSWWRQWVVMAACCCYLWWRWSSDTLWGTLIRLRLH